MRKIILSIFCLMILLISTANAVQTIGTITRGDTEDKVIMWTNPYQPTEGKLFNIYFNVSHTYQADDLDTQEGELYITIDHNQSLSYVFDTVDGVTTPPYTIRPLAEGEHIVEMAYHTNGPGNAVEATFPLYIWPLDPNAKDIPEFPTIAAPVAVLVGLIAVFGRKKE